MNVTVTADAGSFLGELIIGDKTYPCALGRSGIVPADQKTEGDGATPAGTWPVRELFYREGRVLLPSKLAFTPQIITNTMVWTDEPEHPQFAYNQLSERSVEEAVEHPERLMRKDSLYDIILPLGYNDDPAVAGKGSAIFWHVSQNFINPTAGCIAMNKSDLLQVLPLLTPESTVTIQLR